MNDGFYQHAMEVAVLTAANKLLHSELLNLSLISKGIWKIVSEIINSSCTFRADIGHYKKYNPKRFSRVSILDLQDELKDLPITHISLHNLYSSTPISAEILPKTLLSLSLNGNAPIVSFPPNIKSLAYAETSLLTVRDPFPALPETLTFLILPQEYNLPITSLPSALVHLKFGYSFNNPVDNLLPHALKYLEFGNIPGIPQRVPTHRRGKFNQSIDHLPPSLLHLVLGDSFNRTLNKLPLTLIHLTLSFDFNWDLNNLPSSLLNLNMERCYYGNVLVDNLPPRLTHLRLSNSFNHPVNNLPRTVQLLSFGHKFNESITALPPAITHLSFSEYCAFKQAMQVYLPSLVHLKLGSAFNKPLDALSESPLLTHLLFADDSLFNQQVILTLPSLTHLRFGKVFNQSVDFLANSPLLTHLTFGYRFNQPVDSLPPNITHLTFGQDFNQPVNDLPRCITHLVFDFYFNRRIDKLPPSVTNLTLGFSFKKPVDHLSSSIKLTLHERYYK